MTSLDEVICRLKMYNIKNVNQVVLGNFNRLLIFHEYGLLYNTLYWLGK